MTENVRRKILGSGDVPRRKTLPAFARGTRPYFEWEASWAILYCGHHHRRPRPEPRVLVRKYPQYWSWLAFARAHGRLQMSQKPEWNYGRSDAGAAMLADYRTQYPGQQSPVSIYVREHSFRCVARLRIGIAIYAHLARKVSAFSMYNGKMVELITRTLDPIHLGCQQ